MSTRQEVPLTAFREIQNNLRSLKGLAMFGLFFLGGAVPSVLQILLNRVSQGAGLEQIPDEAQHQLRLRALQAAYGGDKGIATYLADCPTVLYFLLKGTLFFLPLLVLLVGFDTIAGEVQHRTMRYMVTRATRSSLVVGKSLGIWAVVSTMVLVLHVTVWLAMVARSDVSARDILSWGSRLWLFSIVYAAAYVGLTTLLSSLFRTPIVALFTGLGAMVLMGVINVALSFSEKTASLTYLFPSTYEKWLLSPDISHILGGIGALLVWGALCAWAAVELVKYRDILHGVFH